MKKELIFIGLKHDILRPSVVTSVEVRTEQGEELLTPPSTEFGVGYIEAPYVDCDDNGVISMVVLPEVVYAIFQVNGWWLADKIAKRME